MKKKINLLFAIVIMVIVAILGYFVGSAQNKSIAQTFYAAILEINDSNVLAKGLEVNDINYRGQFYFQIQEKTKLEWRGTDIDISDLDVGDNISITFEGGIQETSPAGIVDVVRVQLLEDDKRQ